MTQLFSALDTATEAALRASIERFGVIVPVVVDQHGQLLDGHHRSRIASELGVPYETTILNTDDPEEIARTLNEDRRQLTAAQRRPIVATLHAEGHSFRAISQATGVSHMQVRRDLEKTDCDPPSQSVGLDGRTYKRQPKAYYGKGDKWSDALMPAIRYFRGWEKREYRFSHVNYKEAQRRLRVLDELAERIAAARTDLEARSIKAKLTV